MHQPVIVNGRHPKDLPDFRWINTVISNLKTRETLENPADPRDNSLVIAWYGWVHGRQAARIR